MGGGSGHNATLLREKGVDVISFDIGPEDFTYQETWKQSPNANGVYLSPIFSFSHLSCLFFYKNKCRLL